MASPIFGISFVCTRARSWTFATITVSSLFSHFLNSFKTFIVFLRLRCRIPAATSVAYHLIGFRNVNFFKNLFLIDSVIPLVAAKPASINNLASVYRTASEVACVNFNSRIHIRRFRLFVSFVSSASMFVTVAALLGEKEKVIAHCYFFDALYACRRRRRRRCGNIVLGVCCIQHDTANSGHSV